MNSEQVLDIFKQTGGYISDSHIVYTSGKHGSAYLNKDAIYPHTAEVSKLCRAIAEEFKGKGVDVVAAPALGGIVLTQWTAHHLSQLEGKEILSVFTEKTAEGEQIWKRGYDKLVAGKKVLIVEDLLTTGGSVKKEVEAVKATGGEPVAVAALVNRGGVKSEDIDGVPLFTLASVNFQAYEESTCPLCQSHVPVNTTVGHGKAFLKKKGKYFKDYYATTRYKNAIS